MSQNESIRIAVSHFAPIFLDLSKSIDKACQVIAEAARHGAQLVAFPESAIPGFPVWCALRAPIYNHDLFCQLASNSMRVPGPEFQLLSRTAKRHQIVVSIGINESVGSSVGCIYNSNLLIDERGQLLNCHRKLMPTFYEKLVWAPGDGAGLRVESTNVGRLGMLICGENTNPLARYSLMAQGEQVHIATYPPVWPTHDPLQSRNYPLADAIRLRSAAHSFEAKAFTLVAGGFMDRPMYEFLSGLHSDSGRILDASPRSVSLVTGPQGNLVSEVQCDDEGLLYCQINLGECVAPKQYHDISGGYNRFDVFSVTVNRRRLEPARFVNDSQIGPLNEEDEKLPDEISGT